MCLPWSKVHSRAQWEGPVGLQGLSHQDGSLPLGFYRCTGSQRSNGIRVWVKKEDSMRTPQLPHAVAA